MNSGAVTMLIQGEDVTNAHYLVIIYLYHVIFTFLHLIALYMPLGYEFL